MTETVPAEKDLALVTVHPEGYAVVTINRPDKRNAMSRAAQQALLDALDEVKAAGSRAIVLTAAGEQSFCAGVDIKEPQDPTLRQYAAEGNSWARVQRALLDHPAVVIAAVNGYALGGGLTLVNSSDIAIAVDTATFGQPEITFGAYPALAGPSTLRRILHKHASWLTFTGERIDAATALRWGLVNEVVPREQLLARASQIAARIGGFDAISVDYAKKAHHTASELGWDAGIAHGLTLQPVLASMSRVPR